MSVAKRVGAGGIAGVAEKAVERSALGPEGERSPGCAAYEGSSFADVWRIIKADPYALPDQQVTLAAFFGFLRNRLAEAGKRTISDPRDILPHFQKLIRPNGICLAGQWKITRDTPYSGYFAKGKVAPIIARASVAMRETNQGAYRSFGMAGKLFPGATRDGSAKVKTANFFVIDNNGGTLARHYVDTEMVTEPSLSWNTSSIRHLPVLVAIAIAQRLADMHPERRQLYPIAEAGVTDPRAVRSPRWMLIRGAAESPRVVAADFRDELRMARAKGALRFDILVRDTRDQPWTPIGTIDFDDDVVSDGCDHRLHFSHPRWKKDAVEA
jgi:hypothetical protein